MADDAPATAAAAGPPEDAVASVVREILSVIPGGCTWLVPVADGRGDVVDFLVAAAGDRGRDIYSRGAARVGARLSDLYPSIVDGPLWRTYLEVLAGGQPAQLPEFRYEERQAGVVAQALFEVSVYPMLGGLLVWWHRVDEDRRRLERTELLGRLGWAEYDLATGESQWSPGMYRIFERDPAEGPMPRAERASALLPEDRGLSEAAWQTLDSGGTSDVTVRVQPGSSVKYLRILSEVARDADGTPLKVYAVVQDVTTREDSRSEIERLTEQLRRREITALAEHRLAAQLQHMIQPIPPVPFELNGLEVMVSYLPAERAVQVGGDWYHAQTLPDGQVMLAIGDVAGHGLEAASGMAHLRYALVAWLSAAVSEPATVLAHLNNLCVQLKITATALVACYEPASRVLRWARAGHPAPLLGRAGLAEAFHRPPGLLLGVDRDTRYPALPVQLHADDIVLLYTDGLVERRASGSTQRLALVERTLADGCGDPGGAGLTRLHRLLREPNPHDDTCIVAVRVRP